MGVTLGGYMKASMLLGAMNKASKMQPLNQKLARYGNEYGISRVNAHISETLCSKVVGTDLVKDYGW